MGYLTGPVNTLADMQVEYNGLLMGADTPYNMPPPWTFLDLPPVKSMDQARTWGSGSWSGPDFSDVFLPQVPLEVSAIPGTTFGQAVNALRAAFTVQATAKPLWVKLPGLALQGIPAKVAQRSIPIDIAFALGVMAENALVQWRCPYPVWQSLPRTVTLIAGATALAGLVFPLFTVADALSYGTIAAAANTGQLTNVGNTPAWPQVTVSGPCDGFTLSLDGNTVTYTGTVSTGQTVTIDYATGRASLSAAGATAGVDRTILLSSRQFSPITDSSVIALFADGGTAAVTIADMWS